MLKFAHLKDLEDLEDVDTFNISGVELEKEGEQGKGGVDVTAVFTYKNPFVVNGKRVSLSHYRRRGGMQHHIFMAIPAEN